MCACNSHKPFTVWAKVTVTAQNKSVSLLISKREREEKKTKRMIQTAQNGFFIEGKVKSSIHVKTSSESAFVLVERLNHIYFRDFSSAKARAHITHVALNKPQSDALLPCHPSLVQYIAVFYLCHPPRDASLCVKAHIRQGRRKKTT